MKSLFNNSQIVAENNLDENILNLIRMANSQSLINFTKFSDFRVQRYSYYAGYIENSDDIAFICGLVFERKNIIIGVLWVPESMRGKGYGSRAIQEIKKLAGSDSVSLAVLAKQDKTNRLIKL